MTKGRQITDLHNDDFPHVLTTFLKVLQETGAVVDCDLGDCYSGLGRIVDIQYCDAVLGYFVHFQLKDDFDNEVSSFTVKAEDIWAFSVRVGGHCGFQVRLSVGD